MRLSLEFIPQVEEPSPPQYSEYYINLILDCKESVKEFWKALRETGITSIIMGAGFVYNTSSPSQRQLTLSSVMLVGNLLKDYAGDSAC